MKVRVRRWLSVSASGALLGMTLLIGGGAVSADTTIPLVNVPGQLLDQASGIPIDLPNEQDDVPIVSLPAPVAPTPDPDAAD